MPRVYAHLHVAGIGWAVMMAVGMGYRMLPMLLPSAMPEGRSLYISAILLQAGVLGLLFSFLTTGQGVWASAFLTVAGLAAFLSRVVWMRARPRRPPTWLTLPDFGVLHTLQSFLYAVLACLVGLWLVRAPTDERSLRVAAAYGVLGIVGFLSQMVLGVQIRILPMFAALHANRTTACAAPPRTPGTMGSQAIRAAVFVLWTVGVPLLATGMFLESAALLRAAGSLLVAAAAAHAAQTATILRHAFGARIHRLEVTP